MSNSSSPPSDSSPGLAPLPNPGPDVNRARQMIVVYAVGCALSIVFVGLRMGCRAAIKAVGLDDWCMVVTAILNIPLTVLTIVFSVKGGTRHLYYLSQDPVNAVYMVKLNWIARPFGYFSLCIGKLSIALLMLRLLERTSRWRKLSLYITSAVNILNPVCLAIIDFAQCEDVEALWNPVVRAHTKCLNDEAISNFALFASSWNTATDFYLALMALNLVWGIQVLTLRKKIAICVFLGCGLVTGIVSAIKTYTLSRHRPDVTWDYFWVYIWNCVEVTILVVLGSLPTLRPLYNRVTGKGTGRASDPYPYQSGSFGQDGMGKTGRNRPSPVGSDVHHPLVDLHLQLQIPEPSHYEETRHVP